MTFFSCRGIGDVSGQTFTIDNCTAGEVIWIEAAYVLYDPQWNPNVNPPTCTLEHHSCRQLITHHEAIRRCNGQHTCNISQTVLNYPQGGNTTLCDDRKDGNVIYISYYCITGTWIIATNNSHAHRCYTCSLS